MQTKYDWNILILLGGVVLILAFGIGLVLLVLYAIWVLLKGQVCTVCGSKVGAGAFPGIPTAAPVGAAPVAYYAAPPPAAQGGAPAFCSGCGSKVSAAFCASCGNKNW